jgi:hypothetical protein
MLSVLGYRTFQYNDFNVEGHNCDFTYTPIESIGHTLLVIDENGKYFTLSFSMSHGECPSGWCTSSNASVNVESSSIDELDKMKYVPKYSLTIPSCVLNEEDFESDFMTFTSIGEDDYYPSGYYSFYPSYFSLR